MTNAEEIRTTHPIHSYWEPDPVGLTGDTWLDLRSPDRRWRYTLKWDGCTHLRFVQGDKKCYHHVCFPPLEKIIERMRRLRGYSEWVTRLEYAYAIAYWFFEVRIRNDYPEWDFQPYCVVPEVELRTFDVPDRRGYPVVYNPPPVVNTPILPRGTHGVIVEDHHAEEFWPTLVDFGASGVLNVSGYDLDRLEPLAS